MGPVSHLVEEKDSQTFRLILGNSWYLKNALQEITRCHPDYLFIFPPLNNYIQEIIRKNSMWICRENCKEKDQQSRRNSIYISQQHCFFSHLREPHLFAVFCRAGFHSFQVPIQTWAVWGGSCKAPVFLFFCFWHSQRSYFYSLFISPIVSLWARRIR